MPRLLGRAMAASLALCLFAAACGNSTSDGAGGSDGGSTSPSGGGGEETRDEVVSITGVPGVTDDAISYAVVGTKTGNPLGTCILDCYVDGIEAYFAYRNSEGGIYGRDLEVADVIDDELGQNQQKALDIVSSSDYFGNFQATLLASGWGDLDEAGIPTYAWGINSTEAANRSHIFPSLAVRCADCRRPAVPYIASQVGATKAASIGYGVSENSKVCTDTVAKAFDLYQDDSGVESVYTNDDLDYGLPNGIGPEVSAMKEAGVDFVSTCIDLNGMKTLANELHRQDMDDVILYHPNSYDQGFIQAAGDLFEGDVVSVQFRPFEADAEGNGLEQFETWMAKQDKEPTELAMVGWINAAMAFDGLLAAGPDFDRQRVTDAFNAITDYTADGLLVPIDWTQAHTPYSDGDPEAANDPECVAYVRVEGGEFSIEDPAKPWLCWEATETPPFEPTPTNFD
ncbi:MAG: ABC transporter substrate-binding protein [Acidimicrobiales bacterium]